MSPMETITVPPQGVLVKEDRGLSSWRPSLEGISVGRGCADGSVSLRVYKGEKEITFIIDPEQARHLAGLLSGG